MDPVKAEMKPPVPPTKTRRQPGFTVKKDFLPKRKAEESPLKRVTVKRSTSIGNTAKENVKHVSSTSSTHVTLKSGVLPGKTKTITKKQPLSRLENIVSTGAVQQPPRKPLELKQPSRPSSQLSAVIKVPPAPSTLVKRANSATVAAASTAVFQAKQSHVPIPVKSERILVQIKNQIESHTEGVLTRRASAKKSLELEKSSSDSLYVSALEDLNLDGNNEEKKKRVQKVAPIKKAEPIAHETKKPPAGVTDYDAEQKDLFSASIYAQDIFHYFKSREGLFVIKDYMSMQRDINCHMRSLLVDWLVEVQENFELNHETLYLAVKLVDLYLSKKVIRKDRLQLTGISALFLACKYEEKSPPSLDDFVYVCDGLYYAEELLQLEVEILKCVDCQLGIPLSYIYLRRYARVAKYDMPLLTLARYILEYCLMDYCLIRQSDSKMACAALYLALRMKEQTGWTPTLEYYSGYKLDDFKDIVVAQNSFLQEPNDKYKTVRNKYSHKLFHKVAKIPLITDLTFD